MVQHSYMFKIIYSLTPNQLVQSCTLSVNMITHCAALVGEPDKRCDILSSLETLTKNYQTKCTPT